MMGAIAIIGVGCTFAFWSNERRDTLREQDRAEVAFITCQLRNTSQRDNRDATTARDELRNKDRDATITFLRGLGAEDDVIESYKALFVPLPPVPSADQQDRDCNADGELNESDYTQDGFPPL